MTREQSIWSRFDKISVLSFTSCAQNRIPELKREFSRIGLPNAEIFWNYPTPLTEFVLNIISKAPGIKWPSHLDCALGHYRIIKTAYELGCRNLLVFEDDARFLKDKTLLEKILTDIPNDFDYLKLNWTTKSPVDWSQTRMASNYWFDCGEIDLRSTGAYAMSRRMMALRIRQIESAFVYRCDKRCINSCERLRIADNYDNRIFYSKEMRHYASLPMPCVQVDLGDRKCSKSNLYNYQKQGMSEGGFECYADARGHLETV